MVRFDPYCAYLREFKKVMSNGSHINLPKQILFAHVRGIHFGKSGLKLGNRENATFLKYEEVILLTVLLVFIC